MAEPHSNEAAEKAASPFWAVFFAGIVVSAFAVCTVAHLFSDDNAGWIIWLFVLPVAGQLASFWCLYERVNPEFYRFNLTATTTCVLGYCTAWFVFSLSLSSATVLALTSYSSLILITGLLILVIRMTAAIMRSPHDPGGTPWSDYSERIRDGVRAHPLWALCLFFILFLAVTYLFGFAFAFHDRAALRKNDKLPALHMENLDSPDEKKSTAPPGSETGLGGEGTAPLAVINKALAEIDQKEKFYFYFQLGEARLNREAYGNCDPHKQLSKEDKNLNKPQFNDCYLRTIVQRIKSGTQNSDRVRIILIGHGDDAQIDAGARRYRSNYELSEARVQNVAFEILQALDDSKVWHNIEWATLPASNESIPQIDIKAADEDKRVVIASVLPIPNHLTTLDMRAHRNQFKRMKLMDYMYFSVYTITTTGYGDIVPTTSYAKFVASLANICEVLFLVVFFNAIISIKGDNPSPPHWRDKAQVVSGEDSEQRERRDPFHGRVNRSV